MRFTLLPCLMVFLFLLSYFLQASPSLPFLYLCVCVGGGGLKKAATAVSLLQPGHADDSCS